MAVKEIVDAHTLIWYLEENPKLGKKAKAVLDTPDSQLVLPIIALSEAVYIVAKGKTNITSATDLISDVTNDPRIEIYPLTFGILQESLALTVVPEMHDRLIVATGVYLQNLGEQVEILTKDNEIALSSILPVIWS